MSQISKILRKDITIKILSVVLALTIWLFILNTENPNKIKKFNLELTEKNKKSLVEKNLKLIDESYLDYVTIIVYGRNEAVKTINTNEFEVVLDFSKVESDIYSRIEIDPPKYIGNGDINNVKIDYYPKYINVNLEKNNFNPYEIAINTMGDLKDDYYIISKRVEPNILSKERIKEKYEKISAAKVFVDVEELDRNIEGKEYDCYITVDGKDEKSGIKVKVYIEVAKEVPIEFQIKGQPYDAYSVGMKTAVPESVKIKGDYEKLKSISSIKTEIIDINGIDESINLITNLIIPESVELVDDKKSISVFIEIIEKPKNIIEVSREQIKLKNTLAKYDYNINKESVYVRIDSVNGSIGEIDTGELVFYIDVMDYSEGSHSVPLEVDLPEKLVMANNVYIVVEVTKNN